MRNDGIFRWFFTFARPNQRLTVLYRTRGDITLQTKLCWAELYVKFFGGEPRRSFTCNMPPFIIVEELWRKICQTVIPPCWWTATFFVRLTSKIRRPIRQRFPGNGFRWSVQSDVQSRNLDQESSFSQPSVANKMFAIASLWFICTIVSPQLCHHVFERTQI